MPLKIIGVKSTPAPLVHTAHCTFTLTNVSRFQRIIWRICGFFGIKRTIKLKGPVTCS